MSPSDLNPHDAFLLRDGRAWLAARLRWRAAELERVREEAEHKGWPWYKRMFRRERLDLLPSPGQTTVDTVTAQVAAAEDTASPNFVRLVNRFGLRAPEHQIEWKVLLLAMVAELDDGIADLCGRAHTLLGVPGGTRAATFGLAQALFDDWDPAVMLPGRPLRLYHLLEPIQPGALPLQWAQLQPDEHVLLYARGFADDDAAPGHPRLPRLERAVAQAASPVPAPDLRRSDVVGSLKADVEAVFGGWARGGTTLPVAQLAGADPAAKELVASIVAAGSRLRLYRLAANLLPQQPADLETFALYWRRDSVLHRAALLIDAHDVEPASPEGLAVARLLSLGGADRRYLLAVREPWPLPARPSFVVPVAKPTAAEQRQVWEDALGRDRTDPGGDAAGVPSLLAGQFNLDLATLRRIVAAAPPAGTASANDVRRALWDACRAALQPRMSGLAQRLDARASLADVVLPKRQKELLRRIAEQVLHRGAVHHEWGFERRMNRGLGISALFAGDSGTGKTMAVETIANDLGGEAMPGLRLDVYRIDLSAVISKYIGETEKNLRRLFDAAEDGAAILLFDEADAIFGKRSEVKDSHDRYSNIEINYLLQRIEAYTGLAILATNMKPALDPAFLRRLRFVVDFPLPGRPERKAIWERAFPRPDPGGPGRPPAPGVPTEGLDFEWLSRLNLSGGNIHTVALNAAFRAATRGERESGAPAAVTMDVILEAARDELVKLGRPVDEADLTYKPKASAPPRASATGRHNGELELTGRGSA